MTRRHWNHMQQAMKSRVGLQTYDVSTVLFSFWDTLTELSSSGPPQYVVTPYFFLLSRRHCVWWTRMQLSDALAARCRCCNAVKESKQSRLLPACAEPGRTNRPPRATPIPYNNIHGKRWLPPILAVIRKRRRAAPMVYMLHCMKLPCICRPLLSSGDSCS